MVMKPPSKLKVAGSNPANNFSVQNLNLFSKLLEKEAWENVYMSPVDKKNDLPDAVVSDTCVKFLRIRVDKYLSTINHLCTRLRSAEKSALLS
jgi:hypothetical protein